ncbi:MAG: class I SAM-dependent methyltransferase, partial [Nostocoides sp.]
RRLGDRTPTAARVVPVAVDLALEPLAPALEAGGLDLRAPTTWVWEGVVPYLTTDAVRATTAQVAALSAPSSRLVVNYQAASPSLTFIRSLMMVVWRVARQSHPMAAEPWRSTWRPDEMRIMLGDHGFDVASDDDLLTLSAGLDLPLGNGASLRNGRVAVAARR